MIGGPAARPSAGRTLEADAVWRPLVVEVRGGLAGRQCLSRVRDRASDEMADGHIVRVPRIRRVEHREQMTVRQHDAVRRRSRLRRAGSVVTEGQAIEVILRHSDVVVPAEVDHVPARA